MTDQTKGLLITCLGVLFVVPDALFVRLIDAEPLVIAFWRGMISGCVILLGVLFFQGIQPIKALLGTGRYGLIYILALGCSGTMFVLAISMTSIANVVFIIASLPVFAAIYSRVFLGEPIRQRMIVTMAAVAVGLAIIGYGSGETEGAHWSGDLMALGVSAVFAAGLTAARRVKQVSMVPAVPLAYIGASLILLLIVNPLSVPDAQWGLVAFHGCFIVVSASLLALGPRYITSAEVGLLILLESVLAPLLAWAILGENPGIWALSGGAVVIAALAISNTVVLLRQR
ncbi:DMT family transporter [Pseudohalocynthiibacter aestuariivivens]|jgi:drug/metabolite transporter (DMT)-like permease|uniref:DMT family transporter n=1 Tax=Pseudohalocynthiibacter aestuariivivens TaxID=1591409 RepID=A0ABV5JG95_9RHOB|nr:MULTISPECIES: DMT family transporter [Pseudohalocynthiibacter]MBS9716193.1 DMT family transporter [Pseudohalocynthiibacter aestuariivivens]MCK0100999.1 DMT family transporter [Pseudohalocynthiibacter sp. F2068]